MRLEKTPSYLKNSISTIIKEARSNITIHYSTCKHEVRFSTGCQIIDHNDYSVYFYEPSKFEILEPKVIKCIDQRSAHQNGIIAIKRWENEIRNFLIQPSKKMETIPRSLEHRKIAVNTTISTLYEKKLIPIASKVQKSLHGRRVVIH